MKTYTFHITGMHCKACIALTEGELTDLPEIKNAKASLKTHTIDVSGDFGDKTKEHIARDLNEVLKPHGYTLSLEKQTHSVKWSEFAKAVPIALGFIALFIILQKLGIVNLVNAGEVTYSTAFLIGIIASLSTCMAVVGGLVLSISANFAKDGDKVWPQTIFHIARLVSFFILGGIIGALGATFDLGGTGMLVIGVVVGTVMLLLGINLLDIFPWAKELQPTLPRFFSKHILGVHKINHTLTPVLAGILTFVLPCGFTQSMQIYALSTGSFWTGAMIMFVFALGTLPVLALLSFGSAGIHGRTASGIFFKSAGLVVIFFALLNILNSFVSAGVIPPIFSF